MRRTTTFAAFALYFAFGGWASAQPAEIPLDQVLISMERTGCYGECPTYSVTINGDGRVVFEGKQFVAHVGSAQIQIAKVGVISLVNRFLAVRFFDLPANYDVISSVRPGSRGGLIVLTHSITDVPNTILRLRLGGQDHTILMRYQVPTELKELALAVDELAETTKWVKGVGK